MTQTDIPALIARIEELEDQVNFLMNHQPATYVRVSRDEKAANEAAVVELLKKGSMQEAVKLFREKHEMPFAEVQRAVEELKQKNGL